MGASEKAADDCRTPKACASWDPPAEKVQEKGRGVPTAPFPLALRSCGFEHGQDTCRLGIRRCDSLKVCSDAAQLAVHKRLDEMQSTIEPREKFVLNLVISRARYLGPIRPHLVNMDNSL